MLENLNSMLCGVVLPISICLVGLFFLFKLKFFFLIHPLRTFKTIARASGGFRPLCVALAGTLGIGNIVGVSSAIIMGGAGAVFWMILSAFIAMSVKYAESFLAVFHRRGTPKNYYGGAPYYISESCKSRHIGRLLGGFFAVLCVCNSLSTGNLVQINSVSGFVNNRLFFGIAFTFVIFLVVLGGERRIQDISSILIPVLSISYVIISLYIIFSNFGALCVVCLRILRGAFSVKGALGGAVGYGISSAIRFGVSRGLLSNEAGCGTSVVAHASSDLDAHSQGCLGIFEVFWDTVILCSLTAFVILIADVNSKSPILLAIESYGKFTGNFGRGFIACACVLFALATVCCQYYYGQKSLDFFSCSRPLKRVYFVLFFSVCIISSILSNEIMWHISDFIIAFLTLYNLIFLLILSKEVK